MNCSNIIENTNDLYAEYNLTIFCLTNILPRIINVTTRSLTTLIVTVVPTVVHYLTERHVIPI